MSHLLLNKILIELHCVNSISYFNMMFSVSTALNPSTVFTGLQMAAMLAATAQALIEPGAIA